MGGFEEYAARFPCASYSDGGNDDNIPGVLIFLPISTWLLIIRSIPTLVET